MALPRFELLTARGAGGIAVVAVRGADRWDHVSRWLRTLGGDRLPAPVAADRPRLMLLVLDGTQTDEVLVVDRPDSDVVEIHLHGSPAVVQAFEAAVGGFTARAPSRAEALLQRALDPQQLALALEQRELDFDGFLATASPVEITAAIERSATALAMVEPQTVVLCGAQNAGKSTLMNRLLFAERVLTGAEPGLTRDPVRELTALGGYPYELVDTAGEGEVTAALDRTAVERGREARSAGALLLLVVDGSRPPGPRDLELALERAADVLLIRSKADLPAADWGDFSPDLTLSCREETSAGAVRAAMGEALRRRRGLPPPGPVGGVAALSRAELRALEDCLEVRGP